MASSCADGAASLWGITLPWISSAITRFGVDSFGHLLVFVACHWLHLVAGAGVCRAAACKRQGDCESQTKANFSEEVVFRFHNCVFRLLIWFFCSCERHVRKFI